MLVKTDAGENRCWRKQMLAKVDAGEKKLREL
jgi:hypothetical protein